MSHLLLEAGPKAILNSSKLCISFLASPGMRIFLSASSLIGKSVFDGSSKSCTCNDGKKLDYTLHAG